MNRFAWSIMAGYLLSGFRAEAQPDLVYRVPHMEKVIVRSNLVYKSTANATLKADLYLPQTVSSNAALPAILFVLGDDEPEQLRNAKDWKFFQSYGRLAAASGYIGVTFNHRSSENFQKLSDVRSDIEDLVRYVRGHARDLNVDRDRLCLWFFSGSGPHLRLAMGENTNFVRCLVAYYPLLASPPGTKDEIEYSSVEQLKRNAPRVPPILMVKARRDGPVLNGLIDEFRKAASAARVPLEYLEHPTGGHAFDILNDDDTSRKIIRQTLEFIRAQSPPVTPTD